MLMGLMNNFEGCLTDQDFENWENKMDDMKWEGLKITENVDFGFE